MISYARVLPKIPGLKYASVQGDFLYRHPFFIEVVLLVDICGFVSGIILHASQLKENRVTNRGW